MKNKGEWILLPAIILMVTILACANKPVTEPNDVNIPPVVCYRCKKEIAEIEKQRLELEKPLTKAEFLQFAQQNSTQIKEVIEKTSDILTVHMRKIIALENQVEKLSARKIGYVEPMKLPDDG